MEQVEINNMYINMGIKGWYWPQGILSMPIDGIHKSWESAI